jgi:hypothetical protein
MYQDGEDMERDRAIAFRIQTKEVAEITLSGVTVVACTLVTAATP